MELGGSLERGRVPRHIAIIMDGNGRWARERGLPRVEGHRRGERSVREVVECCGELGIEHLTLYTFSAENWRRSEEEVGALMRLIEIVARRQIGELHRKGVRLRVLGRIHELPVSLRDELMRDMALTRENTGLNLNLAINYGGRAEIVDAARRLAERVSLGLMEPGEITEEALSRELYCPELPDPDLLIRTGGEFRLSNFLLWQAAYSEVWVTPTLWPDFDRQGLCDAIRWFQSRERRFGGVLESAGV
jgi:undecaprenyl diphosphate synthase